jgi:general secretion pathway protein N
MKKIGGRIVALFALAFFATLIVTAPASLLGKIVEGRSQGQFVLANAVGTVWQGSASPSMRQRSGKLLVLEKLHWDVALLPLLTGEIIINFRWENVEHLQAMVAKISIGQIELNNAVMPLQASVFGELMPLLQPVQLSGNVLIKTDKFIFSRQGAKGNAAADWVGAGSVLSAVNPLGSYRINLEAAGERLDINLLTLSGALLLEGQGSFTVNQGLRFQISARAAADNKSKLDELLSNFGPETAPGVHTLKLMR